MATDPALASGRPSPALLMRIEAHRSAYRAYDRILPRADPQDPRFGPGAVATIARRQHREARRRLDLLAHPIGSLADMRAKAAYLLLHAGDSYLISEFDELAVFLRAMTAGTK